MELDLSPFDCKFSHLIVFLKGNYLCFISAVDLTNPDWLLDFDRLAFINNDGRHQYNNLGLSQGRYYP